MREALTGQHPFAAADERVVAPVRGGPELLADIKPIIDRAMSPSPGDRYADVAALCDALELSLAERCTVMVSARKYPPLVEGEPPGEPVVTSTSAVALRDVGGLWRLPLRLAFPGDGRTYSSEEAYETVLLLDSIEDVPRHRALLEARGYDEAHRPVRLEWVRPPGGNPYVGKRWTTDEREAFARAVNRQGLRMVMWSDGSGDSDTNLSPGARKDPTRIADSARKAARRGGIYVAHDRIEPAALRAMLDAIDRSDATVVELEQLRQIELGC